MIKLPKPTACCDPQTYDHTVPTYVGCKRVDIDLCVSDLVAALNAANITTVGCCCGHGGKVPAYVQLDDGRMLTITDWRRPGAGED